MTVYYYNACVCVCTARLISRPEFRSTDLCVVRRLSLDDDVKNTLRNECRGTIVVVFFSHSFFVHNEETKPFSFGRTDIISSLCGQRPSARVVGVIDRVTAARRIQIHWGKKRSLALVALGSRRTRCQSFREWVLCASVLRAPYTINNAAAEFSSARETICEDVTRRLVTLLSRRWRWQLKSWRLDSATRDAAAGGIRERVCIRFSVVYETMIF